MTRTRLNNRFLILHVERTSNFGKVFLALDTYQNPPRNCAIEVCKPIVQIQNEQSLVREFQKEAGRLKRLSIINHNLPEIYTYFHNCQSYYLVRELVKGTPLSEIVRTSGKLTAELVREILVQLLSVLDFLHQAGVVHQNIQPKNIVLRQSDNSPILTDFGSIERIMTTFRFRNDRKVVSLKNVCSYVPSEQALGKSVYASDLYSLGLTAIYLLTAKSPEDLSIDLNTGSYQVPKEIEAIDLNLAGIIARAIKLDPSDRYSSAREMLNALLLTSTKFGDGDRRSAKHPVSTSATKSNKIEPKASSSKNIYRWGLLLLSVAAGLYFINLGLTTWYTWDLTHNSVVSETPLPEKPPAVTPPQEPVERASPLPPKQSPTKISPQKPIERASGITKQPSILDAESRNLAEIPIFTTGTSKTELRKILGEPNAIQKGYWGNSSAWIYKNRARGAVDLGYLFDRQTDRLRQTEMAVAPTVDLAILGEVLDSLLQGKLTNAVNRELQSIYDRRTNVYSFKVGNLAGNIERDENDNIYIGIWEIDFH